MFQDLRGMLGWNHEQSQSLTRMTPRGAGGQSLSLGWISWLSSWPISWLINRTAGMHSRRLNHNPPEPSLTLVCLLAHLRVTLRLRHTRSTLRECRKLFPTQTRSTSRWTVKFHVSHFFKQNGDKWWRTIQKNINVIKHWWNCKAFSVFSTLFNPDIMLMF